MNIIASLIKRFAPYIVIVLVGFIGGIYFNEYVGKPNITYETVIEKQKIKGQGNKGKFNNEIQINNEQQKEERKKRGLFNRLFRRRKSHAGDTTDTAEQLDAE